MENMHTDDREYRVNGPFTISQLICLVIFSWVNKELKLSPQIPAYLSTFRSDQAKDSAFKHHATDSTSRQGVFGHGIYEPAKS